VTTQRPGFPEAPSVAACCHLSRVKIVSWNIRQGGGRRLDAIVAAIAGHEPDVVVVNELRARTAPQLSAALRAAGLSFLEHTSPAKSENGMLIAARLPLRRRRAGGPARIFRHGLLEVNVEGWATIGAVYGPLHRATLRAFWDRMVRHANRRASGPYLLIGDFNAGESFVDAQAYKFVSSDYFVAIREAGFVDLWRARNAKTEHTWFSFGRRGVPLNGFRIDHALASTSLANDLRRCYYSHAERESRLSDHSALVVEFSTVPSAPPEFSRAR
jgi:exodeoxyribonuclease III